MPSPGGDALAAKLAELVAAEGSPRYWRFNDGRETAARSRVLYRLLAWVAEQGAAAPRRDDDSAHGGTRRVHYPCGCYRFPDGMLAQTSSCRLDHDAPAPDAALRAAGMADAERAIHDAIARRGVPPLVGGAAHRTFTNGMERALEVVRAARAALSPDATGGEA